MTAILEAQFTEYGQTERIASLPMSHLSIELGHLYADEFQLGRDHLIDVAQQVAPWARAARESFAARAAGKGRPRVSTCVLIDDYFKPFSTPGELIPIIVEAYAEAGLTIDYIARESGCTVAAGVPVAAIVEGMLVVDPTPGTDGTRPSVQVSGWLANGMRSPDSDAEAMALATSPGQYKWRPPVENATSRHTVFIDIQLWEDGPDGRTWSCPFLAAVWQMMRLGLLRYQGRPVVEPVPYESAHLDSWDAFPAVVQLSAKNPAPFTAYSTFSALSTQYLGIEHAVRTILGQVAIQPEVEKQVQALIDNEHLRLSTGKTIDRVDYAFLGPNW
jgi:hypothetical protein